MRARFRTLALRTLSLGHVATAGILLIAVAEGAAAAAETGTDAEEAEAQFTLGRKAYETHQYDESLAYFLASQRLAPNRNVVFNVARCFEQLKRYPEAFHHYNEILEGEKDLAFQERLRDALARVAPYVAVLQVVTDPPGATVYVDRRELGARATTPHTLGLAPGTHTIFLEKSGYAPRILEPYEFAAGSSMTLPVALVEIRGSIELSGTPDALATLDAGDGAHTCRVPCTLHAPPGLHTLSVAAKGYLTSLQTVKLKAGEPAKLRLILSPILEALVVHADIPDALVSVDGKPLGFAPTVANVAVGKHTISVARDGYTTFEQSVDVSAGRAQTVEADLRDKGVVVAASRISESVQDAPGSVSVITREEIRAMGYPTIAEALRGVRGFYISDDRNYASLGVRGLSPSGQYGNRFLVLLDGHPLNDDYIGSSYVGYDGRVDLEDIERIEVMRGPGAVTHGAGAMYGVINLVTRGRNEATHVEVSASTPEPGLVRSRVAGYVQFAKNAGIWASASVADSQGHDWYFPEFVKLPGATGADGTTHDPSRDGIARGVDGFQAASVSGRVWAGDFTMQWFFHTRKKHIPTGFLGSTFGSEDTRFSDTRGLLEARYEPRISKKLQMLVRGHLNFYDFDGFSQYSDSSKFNGDTYRGRWGGLEVRAYYTGIPHFQLLVGTELQRHFETSQSGFDAQGAYLRRNDPFWMGAAYVSATYDLGPKLRLNAGLRFARFSSEPAPEILRGLSPKAALIWKPDDKTSAKLLLTKAFKSPSVFELYYLNREQVAPAVLRSDELYGAELEVTRKVGPISVTIDGFTWLSKNPIELADNPQGQPEFRNSPNNLWVAGTELELKRDFGGGKSVSFTYSYQRPWFEGDNTRRPKNSLEHLASVRGAYPVVNEALVISTRIAVEGPRADKNDQITDAPQGTTRGAIYWDLVTSGEVAKQHLRYAFGLYNIADVRGATVPSVEFRQHTIASTGRTLLFSLTATY